MQIMPIETMALAKNALLPCTNNAFEDCMPFDILWPLSTTHMQLLRHPYTKACISYIVPGHHLSTLSCPCKCTSPAGCPACWRTAGVEELSPRRCLPVSMERKQETHALASTRLRSIDTQPYYATMSCTCAQACQAPIYHTNGPLEWQCATMLCETCNNLA
jgi:hypothetical protein